MERLSIEHSKFRTSAERCGRFCRRHARLRQLQLYRTQDRSFGVMGLSTMQGCAALVAGLLFGSSLSAYAGVITIDFTAEVVNADGRQATAASVASDTNA